MALEASSRKLIQPLIQANGDNQRRYAVCGTRLYSLATLNGQFPDMGDHQPGEMGGIWAPPLKLLDGFWLGVRAHGAPVQWLTSADAWQMASDGVTLSYHLPGLGVLAQRREWVVPNEPVLVVDLSLSRQESAPWQHSLTCEVGLLARSDLHGAWLAEERLGWADGNDLATYDPDLGAVLVCDALHPWEVCFGATTMPVSWQIGRDIWGPERTSGRGTGAWLWYRCRLTPERPAHLRFLIVGAASERCSASTLFARLARPCPSENKAVQHLNHSIPLLESAQQRAGELFLQPFSQCLLETPDPHLNEVFAWAKAFSAMLLLEVPGLGRAPMGGLPEFPWWFGCDLAYGVLPMLPAGQAAEAGNSLRTLARHSQGEGRVPHEVISHGLVFHPGNLVEIPLFARALYHVYRWTGDQALLEALFPFCLQGIEQYALGACLKAGEQVPQGASIVETPEMAAGVQTLDVGAYLVESLDLLAALADDLRRAADVARLRERASDLRQHLCRDWWLPADRLFGDLRASRVELELLAERFSASAASDTSSRTSSELLRCALAEQHRERDPHERQPWLLQHMVQALAVDAGLPTPEQAAALLARLETPEWTEPYGLVLNAATNRQVMTLPTGALAVGEARYGRADQALDSLLRMASAFGGAMPGMLSEYAPDGGCFLQLWSNYGTIWPIVHYFFGLRPDVARKRLLCIPQLPSAWPSASLSDVAIGEMQVQIRLVALSQGLRVVLETTAPEWEITLGAALPAGVRVTSAALNGRLIVFRQACLAEHEGRATWLAPALRGRTTYELIVSWTGSDQPAHTL